MTLPACSSGPHVPTQATSSLSQAAMLRKSKGSEELLWRWRCVSLLLCVC